MRNVPAVRLGVLALILVAASSAAIPVRAGKPPTGSMGFANSGVLSNDALMIARVRAQWLGAVNAADLPGILAAYAPGAVVLPEALPPLLGDVNISRWHERWVPLAVLPRLAT